MYLHNSIPQCDAIRLFHEAAHEANIPNATIKIVSCNQTITPTTSGTRTENFTAMQETIRTILEKGEDAVQTNVVDIDKPLGKISKIFSKVGH